VAGLTKRLVVGRPLNSASLGDQLLPKWIALPVFCSDPLSSVAYATQEIVLVLGLAGVAALTITPWVGLAICFLLIIVVASYRQTCFAYPNGGGAYVVSKENFGPSAALVAASALMVDYVLTVAVSVASGVAALVSYFPSLDNKAIVLSTFAVVLLTVVNLRGIKESGQGFALPTYGFVILIYLMFGFAVWKLASGQGYQASSAGFGIRAETPLAGIGFVLLVLRAFASGCTALTGVEAVSNGVPAFRKPKSKNASSTLAIMGFLAVSMFAGITVLATIAHVHMAESPGNLIGAPANYVEPTALAQLGEAAFGNGILFLLLQLFTAGILVLAANTAYNGFPVLASILSRDGYLPRQLHNRGDRLVFSNGILALSVAAVVLIWAFDADVTKLVELYIIGVFVSFTLSQAGMVKHWQRKIVTLTELGARLKLRRSQVINATGATVTAVVLVIVLLTKFTHGAWLVCIAMPALYLFMMRIHKHYDAVDVEVTPNFDVTLPSRVHAVVLVSKLHQPTLRALAFARSTRPSTLEAVTVMIDEAETEKLLQQWAEHVPDVRLVVLESPYREVTRPVLDYVAALRRDSPRDLVSVYIPEYVVAKWREQVLHNQSSLRLKSRLLFQPGVMVTNVPYLLNSAKDAGDVRSSDREWLALAATRYDESTEE
jgi:amino acid transporter